MQNPTKQTRILISGSTAHSHTLTME